MLSIDNQEQLNQYIAKSGFNGVILVSKENEFLIRKAYGYKNFENHALLSVTDRFQIGSVTKQFVAASLLKLQQENKLNIDDDAKNYLPGYDFLKGITIRDLLNHTSGIANFTDQKEFWENVKYDVILSLKEILNFISKLSNEFTPKSNYSYSNSGYIIAGQILENVSGKSWIDYLRENFFTKLQMQETGYQDYFEEASEVVGYVTYEGQQYSMNKQFNLSWALTAGGLYSTVDDLLKWSSIYHDSNILNDNSRVQMQTPFLENYALGIVVSKTENNKTMISHNGRTPGFVTNVSFLKEDQLKVITLDNTDGSRAVMPKVLIEFFSTGKTEALKYEKRQIEQNQMSEYVGVFQHSTKMTKKNEKFAFKIFIKDSQLWLQPNDGQPPYLMTAVDVDSYNVGGFAGEEFIRNEEGKIVAVKHYQGGHASLFRSIYSK